MRGKIKEAGVDLIAQRAASALNWMNVNK